MCLFSYEYIHTYIYIQIYFKVYKSVSVSIYIDTAAPFGRKQPVLICLLLLLWLKKDHGSLFDQSTR